MPAPVSKRSSPLSKRISALSKRTRPIQPDPFLQESAPSLRRGVEQQQHQYHSPARDSSPGFDDEAPFSPLSFTGLGNLSPLAISPPQEQRPVVVDLEMDLLNCELMTSDDDPIMTSDDDEMSC